MDWSESIHPSIYGNIGGGGGGGKNKEIPRHRTLRGTLNAMVILNQVASKDTKIEADIVISSSKLK